MTDYGIPGKEFWAGSPPVKWAIKRSLNYNRRCKFYEVLKAYQDRFYNPMPIENWETAWKISES